MTALISQRIAGHTLGFAPQKKHPQFILAIDKEYFSPFYAAPEVLVSNFQNGVSNYPIDVFLEEVMSFLVIRERDWLDERVYHQSNQPADEVAVISHKGDRSYLQILPYCMIRQLQEDGSWLYFPYRRTKKVGESRLAGNVSFGYGGHIDLADVKFDGNSVIQLHDTIMHSAAREVFDEESQFFDEKGEPAELTAESLRYTNQFIVDTTNEVNSVHVAVVLALNLPTGWTVKMKEDELTTMPPMSAFDMMGLPDMESWTKLLVLEAIRIETEASMRELAEMQSGQIITAEDLAAATVTPERLALIELAAASSVKVLLAHREGRDELRDENNQLAPYTVMTKRTQKLEIDGSIDENAFDVFIYDEHGQPFPDQDPLSKVEQIVLDRLMQQKAAEHGIYPHSQGSTESSDNKFPLAP